MTTNNTTHSEGDWKKDVDEIFSHDLTNAQRNVFVKRLLSELISKKEAEAFQAGKDAAVDYIWTNCSGNFNGDGMNVLPSDLEKVRAI